MIKTFVPVLFLVAAALGAQEPAPPAAAAGVRNPRIAVINMETISSESIMGKGYAAQIQGLEREIQTEGTKKQAELAKMDAAIKALQDELDKQAAVLSPKADAAERAAQAAKPAAAPKPAASAPSAAAPAPAAPAPKPTPTPTPQP